MNNKRLYFLIGFICLFISCSKNKEAVVPKNGYSSLSDVFEIFWTKMNQNYVYWDVDPTNWDNIHTQYQPLFAKLDIKNNNDVKIAAKYFKQMSSGLIDGHFNITFSPSVIADSLIFPAYTRKMLKVGYRSPYSFYQIDKSYLDSGFHAAYDTTNARNVYALCGIINKKYLYFSCSKFVLASAYNANTPNSTKTILNFFFSQISTAGKMLRGIIIDVRDNPGGDIEDINFLLGRFLDAPLQIGYTRYKSFSGRLDYTPWIGTFINHPKLM